MRIVIINHSDHLGGAAKASTRLARALADAGHDVRMLLIDRSADADASRADVVGSHRGNNLRFLAERLEILLRARCRRADLFAIDIATRGVDAAQHQWARQADVIVLGWVNQAMLSLADVRRLADLGKPVVWIMHDMWNLTGLCHYSHECSDYTADCGHCQLLRPAGNSLATRTLRRKRQLYEHSRIHFVAVSHWLEQCAKRSTLLRDQDVTVIPNAIDIADFTPQLATDNPWNIPDDRCVVAVASARLDVMVKGFDLLIDTTRHISRHNPDLAGRIHLLLCGAMHDLSLLDKIEVPYTHLGYVDDMRQVYSHSHILLSTARYESFGYTLLEGMASGCTPVTTAQGGQGDIVEHSRTGFIAPSVAPADIADALQHAVDAQLSRDFLHQQAEARFGAPAVAQQFVSLFNKLLNDKQ